MPLGNSSSSIEHLAAQLFLKKRFVSGHGFGGCGKTLFPEGYGLQAVHNCFEISAALAAERGLSFKRHWLCIRARL
jgi:hypothetical protein